MDSIAPAQPQINVTSTSNPTPQSQSPFHLLHTMEKEEKEKVRKGRKVNKSVNLFSQMTQGHTVSEHHRRNSGLRTPSALLTLDREGELSSECVHTHIHACHSRTHRTPFRF